jgi:hypothetical protein
MFGLSGSTSKSKSTSTSGSYGYQGSTSQSGSTSFGSSSQSLAFQDLFAQLYGGAASTAAGMSGQPVQDAASMLFSGGVGFLDQLQGSPEQDYLAGRVSGANPLLDEQIGALGDDLGRFFRDELNPTITGDAVAAGALGGGRQGVAQGAAAAAVGREFQRGATELRTGDMMARDAAARDLMASRTANAGVGLGSLGALLGVAQTGSLANLAPFQALASIMGGPTTLTTSESGSIAQAIADSFGEDSAWAKSKSTSSGKSAAIGF